MGKDDRFVMIGGHADTTYVSPGAVDNTAGVATVMEIARQLAPYKDDLKHTIKFAAWSGEEEGLFGSTLYVDAHREEINTSLIAYLNLDMNHINLARGVGCSINSNNNETLSVFENITAFVKASNPDFEKYQIGFGYWEGLTSSDQAPFAKMGKDFACFWGSGCTEYHTPHDTLEFVTPESLAFSGMIYGSYALYLAADLGAGRKS